MTELQNFPLLVIVLGAALLFFLTERRQWLLRLPLLRLPWGEVSRYLRRIHQEFGLLNTLGLGQQVSIYVLSSNLGSGKSKGMARAPSRQEKFSSNVCDVEQIMQRALHEKKALLMIGAPNSGKTTLLKVLALRSTDREMSRRFGFAEPRIPFYIPAKEIDFDLPFLPAMQQALWQNSFEISQKTLKKAVRSRRAFFLLDGLDEIPAGIERQKACAWIESAQRRCGSEVPFIITCRTRAFLEDVKFDFPYLTVAIRNFALSHHRSLPAVSESRMPSRFLNAVEDHAEYVLIAPPALPTLLMGAKKPAPAYYFYLAKYPVTNRLYRKFVEATDHRLPAFWDDPEFNGDDCPVVGVDWEDAQAYCAWLTEQGTKEEEKNRNTKSNVIYRLPLEEEWEWAAGGGRRKFPWGDSVPQKRHANFNGTVQGLTPINAFPDGATPEGLMDMAGNVWEWTATWRDEKKEQRILRGGAGFNDAMALRCVSRDSNSKKLLRFVGFRVARIVTDQ
ncbi:MAG: SUMF1/EgtB/PvdO family nonheme iron enzyme [candidate division KSB1 bacterium]|nr:SUMF1/EgtB/PvdO family nonheme iron enzyme [candidate division KSB1 bacterium]MDZ7300541.1 SUMF1/EgtB/PvdO family nonheme iron enzyme [candidate division KSB1 bacterium]MDZ7309680.1 SUMF1/EgtB/PvdO family nonheme iron enzyme [candidate division KSB1 bacterium]